MSGTYTNIAKQRIKQSQDSLETSTPSLQPDGNSISDSQIPPKDMQEKDMKDTTVSTHHDTVIPRNHDTMASDSDVLETIRIAVMKIGKESATQRLTAEEKQELKDIEYQYERKGIKTSGNEIIRISINYLVRDFRTKGEDSILAKVIRKLNP